MSIIVLDKVSKKYSLHGTGLLALDKISLKIDKGEFVCILGPSGCGKTTLLSIIAGLEQPTEGSVIFNGKQITAPGPDRAVIFQEPALFPWLTILENVEFGMKMARIPEKTRRKKSMKYLKMVHLARFRNSFVHQLSGGMKQRAALARALTMDSEVLLMDEPFASLDSQTKSILRSDLQKIWLETGKTVLFVTHDIEEAVLQANRIVVLSSSPGRIKQQYTIDIPYPRSIENPEVIRIISDISKGLEEEVEKVAKAEYDSNWSIKNSTVSDRTGNSLGNSL